MKAFNVKVTNSARRDIKEIISYIKHELLNDIVVEKYKILFKEELNNLKYNASIMPVLSKKTVGRDKIRKINVKKYLIFYTIKNDTVYVLRILHESMEWDRIISD